MCCPIIPNCLLKKYRCVVYMYIAIPFTFFDSLPITMKIVFHCYDKKDYYCPHYFFLWKRTIINYEKLALACSTQAIDFVIFSQLQRIFPQKLHYTVHYGTTMATSSKLQKYILYCTIFSTLKMPIFVLWHMHSYNV